MEVSPEQKYLQGRSILITWYLLKKKLMGRMPDAKFEMLEYGGIITAAKKQVCGLEAVGDTVKIYYMTGHDEGLLYCSSFIQAAKNGPFPDAGFMSIIETERDIEKAVYAAEKVWRKKTGLSRMPSWEHLEI